MTIVVSVEISIQFCRFFKGIYCENVKSRCIQKLESKNRLCDLFLRIFGCPKDLKNSPNLTFDQKGIISCPVWKDLREIAYRKLLFLHNK